MHLQVCTQGPVTAVVSGPWDDIEVVPDYDESTTWFMGRDDEDWSVIGTAFPFDGELVFEHDSGAVQIRGITNIFVTNDPQKVGT